MTRLVSDCQWEESGWVFCNHLFLAHIDKVSWSLLFSSLNNDIYFSPNMRCHCYLKILMALTSLPIASSSLCIICFLLLFFLLYFLILHFINFYLFKSWTTIVLASLFLLFSPVLLRVTGEAEWAAEWCLSANWCYSMTAISLDEINLSQKGWVITSFLKIMGSSRN